MSASIRGALHTEDKGIYIVYGVYIEGTSLNVQRVYSGKFEDIQIRLSNDSENPKATYLLPLPEFLVNFEDPEYAKYVNVHFVKEADIESDTVMTQKFCEAFARNMAAAQTDSLSEQLALPESDVATPENVQAVASVVEDAEAVLARLEDSLRGVKASKAQHEAQKAHSEVLDVEAKPAP